MVRANRGANLRYVKDSFLALYYGAKQGGTRTSFIQFSQSANHLVVMVHTRLSDIMWAFKSGHLGIYGARYPDNEAKIYSRHDCAVVDGRKPSNNQSESAVTLHRHRY